MFSACARTAGTSSTPAAAGSAVARSAPDAWPNRRRLRSRLGGCWASDPSPALWALRVQFDGSSLRGTEMSTAIETPRHRVEPVTAAGEQIFLENGALMSRAEFHQLYRDAPENIRAELIGGIV